MKFVKQKSKLTIFNLDTLLKKKKRAKRHGNLLPDNIRCIICGPSNCGKTNLVLNLIFSSQGLHFENIYVFSKSLYQPKYEFLRCVLEKMSEIGYYSYTDSEEVPHPSEVRSNSVMIFDDVACGKQENIKNYFSMGRHNGVDTIYVCQTYSYIPKQLVRDNSNFIIAFKQDDRNLQHIYHDHVNPDMDFKQFKNMCSKIWQNKNNFIVIDKESGPNDGRYRSGFDTFVKI